jgi:SAM-dependent methyltransferase
VLLAAWRARVRQRLAHRALQRQLDFQAHLAQRLRDPDAFDAAGRRKKAAVQDLLSLASLPPHARVLEVGGGGVGLLRYLPDGGVRVGIDPLAVPYRHLFGDPGPGVHSCAAYGEQLPFRDQAFDVVLCDNVIDHAEDPARIVHESIRVLKGNGTLYFSVNFHHPIYGLAAMAYRSAHALGLRIEIGPFADHTVHLTRQQVRAMLAKLPLTVQHEREGIVEARQKARAAPPRHAGDRLKRLFFKNARYVMVAVKRPGA